MSHHGHSHIATWARVGLWQWLSQCWVTLTSLFSHFFFQYFSFFSLLYYMILFPFNAIQYNFILAIIFVFLYMSRHCNSHIATRARVGLWQWVTVSLVTSHQTSLFSRVFSSIFRFSHYFTIWFCPYSMLPYIISVWLQVSFFVYVTSLSLSHSNPSSGWSVALHNHMLSVHGCTSIEMWLMSPIFNSILEGVWVYR